METLTNSLNQIKKTYLKIIILQIIFFFSVISIDWNFLEDLRTTQKVLKKLDSYKDYDSYKTIITKAIYGNENNFNKIKKDFKIEMKVDKNKLNRRKNEIKKDLNVNLQKILSTKIKIKKVDSGQKNISVKELLNTGKHRLNFGGVKNRHSFYSNFNKDTLKSGKIMQIRNLRNQLKKEYEKITASIKDENEKASNIENLKTRRDNIVEMIQALKQILKYLRYRRGFLKDKNLIKKRPEKHIIDYKFCLINFINDDFNENNVTLVNLYKDLELKTSKKLNDINTNIIKIKTEIKKVLNNIINDENVFINMIYELKYFQIIPGIGFAVYINADTKNDIYINILNKIKDKYKIIICKSKYKIGNDKYTEIRIYCKNIVQMLEKYKASDILTGFLGPISNNDKLRNIIKNKTIEDSIIDIKELITNKTKTDNLSILGMNIPKYSIYYFGPLITTILIIYIYFLFLSIRNIKLENSDETMKAIRDCIWSKLSIKKPARYWNLSIIGISILSVSCIIFNYFIVKPVSILAKLSPLMFALCIIYFCLMILKMIKHDLKI